MSADFEESTNNDEANLNILPNVSSTTMRGMRILDSISDDQCESFFSVEINGRQTGIFRRQNPSLPLIG